MTQRALWAGVLAVVLALSINAVALGAPSTPVITTPTPQPTATPKPLTLQERLALTPEAERRVTTLFLPLTVGTGHSDVNPASFAYTIKPGDTLWSLALDFGRDLDTMSCVTTPTGSDAEKLTPGQVIEVPALTDLCYTVRPGETLRGIASRNKTTVEAIVAVPWNGFYYQPYQVVPKQRILIPGARTDAKPRADRKIVSRPADQWGAPRLRTGRMATAISSGPSKAAPSPRARGPATPRSISPCRWGPMFARPIAGGCSMPAGIRRATASGS